MSKRIPKKPPRKAAARARRVASAPARTKELAKGKSSTKTKVPAKVKASTLAARSNHSSTKARKAVSMTKERAKDKPGDRATASEIVLPPDYRPSDDEPFMGERHRAYFRAKLLSWREDIVRQTRETLAGLHEDSTQHADIADRATSETDRALELRARDRQRKLIAKIDAALARIEDGTYGYCEDTGEPIGLKRLDARPIATLSLEAQERHERRERVYRED